MEAGTSAQPEQNGYSGAAVAGAVLATFFFPLFSLIAALLLLGGQTNPDKRASLRMWAWASGGWILLQLVVVIALIGSVAHSSGDSGPSVTFISTSTTISP
jgi:hypothetical protein